MFKRCNIPNGIGFADIKKLLVRDEAYWEAMQVVPILLLAGFCLGCITTCPFMV